MDIKIEKVESQEEQLSIQDWISEQIKQSEMWEINNPRVNAMMRAIVAIVADMKSLEDDERMSIINNVFGLVSIYGDKDFSMKMGEEE
tara:strand:+ start:204 stop:467 length:264 start_codon:yes stop_codon:yes gene_type:complete